MVARLYEECFFFLRIFERQFFRFFMTLKNYINAEMDKTEMLMNLKKKRKEKRTLLREIEYYQVLRSG